jgi:hypothetical protein
MSQKLDTACEIRDFHGTYREDYLFWNVTPHTLIHSYRRFGGNSYLYLDYRRVVMSPFSGKGNHLYFTGHVNMLPVTGYNNEGWIRLQHHVEGCGVYLYCLGPMR